MRSSEPHLPETELARLASEDPANELPPHVRACADCRRTLAALAAGLHQIRQIEASKSRSAPGPETRKRNSPLGVIAAANRIAREILEAAEDSQNAVSLVISRYDDDPALANGLLYACQTGSQLSAKSPSHAAELADLIRLVVEGREDFPDHIPPELVIAEANVLDSQAALNLGSAVEARVRAQTAREVLHALGAPPLSVARARYYEASALGFLNRTDEAIALFKEAKATFLETQQDHWVAKADGAIGVAMFQRANDPAILDFFDSALERLHPERDAQNVASILQNKALLLIALDRRVEAREVYSRCLAIALKSQARSVAVAARINLLALLIDDGSFDEAIRKGTRLLEQAETAYLDLHAFHCRLLLAEANAGAGHMETAAALLGQVASNRPAELAGDTELSAAFERMDLSDIEMLRTSGWLRRVRGIALGWPAEEDEKASA